MVKWVDKRFSGQEAIVAKRFRLGYGWNATRSKGDESAKDANYVGSISLDVSMKPQKTAEDMQAALIRTLQRILDEAQAELKPLPSEKDAKRQVTVAV